MIETAPIVIGLNHVAIVSRDLDAFVDFYTDVFGLEVALLATTPDFRHALLRVAGDSMLHAFELPENPHAAGSSAELDRGHLDHLAFTVPDAETFDAVRQRLRELGATDGVVYDGGATHSVHFSDPDGMWSELVLVTDPTMTDVHEPRPLVDAR